MDQDHIIRLDHTEALSLPAAANIALAIDHTDGIIDQPTEKSIIANKKEGRFHQNG